MSKASQCTGKVAFDEPQTARRAASRLKHRIHYRCPHCKKWHVGKKAK